MAETFSVERRKLMRFLGAKVVLTPAAQRGIGMVAKAIELAKAHGWFLTRQFENEANPDIHSRTTAREIIADFKGEPLDYWVTGYGTGGTLKGVSRVLAKERPDTKIVVCEPADAQLLAQRHAAGAQSGRLARRRPPGLQAASHAGLDAGLHPEAHRRRGRHEADRPHHPDRRPRCAQVQPASSPRRKASSSASPPARTFAGALQVAAEAPKGATILCMLPDTGERYLSTPLFADIAGRHDDGGDRDLALDPEPPVPGRDLKSPGRMEMTTKHHHALLVSSALLASLAAPAYAENCPAMRKINIGVSVAPPNVVHTSPYVAKALGFFEKRCIDANIVQFEGGQSQTSAVAAAQGSAIVSVSDVRSAAA